MTETDADFEQILAAITDGVVVVDQRGIVLYANQSAERIFERGKLPGRDLAVPLSPASAHQDINLIRRSGIGWAELRSAPITWAGQAAYVIGVRDITERRNSELGLRLATAVFDSTREGLLVTDVNKRIVRINPSFTDITGYSEADVLGKNPVMIGSGRHKPEFYEAMWGSIASVGYWQGEIWNRRKSGEIYPALASVTVIKSDSGAVSNYVAVFADITSLKKSQSDLEYLAHYDPLTGLPNRLLLISNLQHAILRAQRDGKCLALLMIDLDRFKDINDSFGHLAGDELLQQVSGRLILKRREMDTICRLGGDEFTVLIEDVGKSENAARIANEIIKALSEPYKLSNAVEVRIGASVGISIFPGHGDTAELMLQQADSALYKAKTEGRGRFVYFSESLTLAARNRLDLEVRLRHAISHDELRVFYQPQVDIASGRIVGAEALVRWQSPSEGLISPARFINIAEECGLIGEIDKWVLRETCAQGQRWIAGGFMPITLAVNMSAYQLLEGDTVLSVAQVLSDTGFPATYLELELTESALMKRETEAILILNQLRALGVQLAIDDFGTGYSSLAYLKLFPLDVLKIDKRFIDDVPLHRDDMEIVTAIIAMGHSLRLKVLAEGVENKDQLAYLKTQGCDLFQGYLMSRPVPAGEFEQMLEIL
jgi:diguanylate cyclase (GGDEF)-like protein/PAS domain S-box-containing protein